VAGKVRSKQLSAAGAANGDLMVYNSSTGLWTPVKPVKWCWFPSVNLSDAVATYRHIASAFSEAAVAIAIEFFIPGDFDTLVSAHAVMYPKFTDTSRDLDVFTDYSGNTELVYTHSALANLTIASPGFVTDTRRDVDVSTLFDGSIGGASIAALDVGGLGFTLGTEPAGSETIEVMGMRMSYRPNYNN